MSPALQSRSAADRLSYRDFLIVALIVKRLVAEAASD